MAQAPLPIQTQSATDQQQRKLAAALVVDLEGNEVLIESLWSGKATLFVFLRHYG